MRFSRQFASADGRRPPCRSAHARARAAGPALRRGGAALASALLLYGGTATADPGAASRPELRRLAALVRSGDDRALAQLRQAEFGFGDGASYGEQLGYLQLLAQACRDAGQSDAGYVTDERIARLAAADDDRANAALGALGRVGQLMGREPAAALEALGALDAQYAHLREPRFVASVQQLYGDLYAALGQFDFALGHYLKALEIARTHPEFLSPTAAGLRVSIARVYTYTRAPDKILAALPDPGKESLAPRARARVFLYKGIAEVFLGHAQQARDAYGQALAVARAHGLLVLQADILGNIADSYLTEHRYPQAERAARAAIPVARQAGDASAIMVTTVNLGFALAGQGRLAEGLKVIDEVIAQMRKAGNLPDLADVLQEKSRALERAGRHAEALATLREHEEIVARLGAAEREKTVAVLQEQFSAQQRAIQIEGLRRENAVKDREIQERRVWQIIASGGAGLALLLCGFVYRLYRRTRRTQLRLEELNAELEFHSTHDALTGLLNRRSFRERMLVRDGRLGAQPSECFILLDIDHFKAINDRHGHAAGDEVLVEMARRLRAVVAGRGLVMRWGGEEFLVYVDALDACAHADLVREILDALGAQAVVVEGEALTVSATAGALSLPARDAGAVRGWQQAVAQADQALYKGKQGGRKRAYLVDGAAARPGAPRHELILPSFAGDAAA